jgi:glycosyltransferase involved in cell wall biosynthesis
MAYGKAILTFERSFSIKQCVEYHYIQHGINGWIFKSIEEATLNMIHLTINQLSELGQHGRDFVTMELTIENMVNNAFSVLFNPIEILATDKINLYFWQNCVSPHQLPYIKEIFNDERIGKVYLIAPVEELDERRDMGWERSSLTVPGVEIIIAPDTKQVLDLFKKSLKHDIHLFSGTRAFSDVFHYFNISLGFNIKRGIITEPPFRYKVPIWMHKLRFLVLDYRYISKIEYIFAIGDSAVKYYRTWSDKWKVIPFAYCVEENKHVFNEVTGKCKLIYVGSLIHRKNVALLLKSLNHVTGDFQLGIVGDGAEKERLEKYVIDNQLSDNVRFLGKKNNSEILNLLQHYDSLVLPSLHDGWGAVINEALQNGLYVICSDQCGAKTLIENSNRGIVFKNKDVQSLTNALNYCIGNADKIKSGKQERVDWSACISGVSMASYMVDCLFENEPVIPPWKK